jgi:hypothetical protein
MDSFIGDLEKEDEEESMAFISNINIRCTPISSIGLRQMKGETVEASEIRNALDKTASARKDLLIVFNRLLRKYVGGVYNTSGKYWEFGLCGDEDDVAKMSREAGSYESYAEQFCLERNYSRASMEPKPNEKLDSFFEMLQDMGLNDVEDLQEEPYSVRVIVKAMKKMNMLKTIPISAWRAKRPSSYNDSEWLQFRKLLSIPLGEDEE